MYLAQCIMTTKAQFKTRDLLSLVPWQIDCHRYNYDNDNAKDNDNDKQSEAIINIH